MIHLSTLLSSSSFFFLSFSTHLLPYLVHLHRLTVLITTQISQTKQNTYKENKKNIDIYYTPTHPEGHAAIEPLLYYHPLLIIILLCQS